MGDSVVTVALDICLQMKCKSVIFIGLDFNNLAHAEGTSRWVANDIEDLPKGKGYKGWMKKELSYIEVYSS